MNHVNNNGETFLMQVCKLSNNDDNYDIIKQLLDDKADPLLIDNSGNRALNYLAFDGHKNPKTIKLLTEHTTENNKIEKIQSCEMKFKELYLNYFVKHNIKLPPLTGDSYDWKIEYVRVSTYKNWKLFSQDIYEKTEFLGLNGRDLSELPKEIGNLVNLKKLNITQNNLSDLPHEISNLKNLECLYIGNNKFKEIPKCVLSLKNLKTLSFRDNEINIIAIEIFELNKLDTLYCYNNKIQLLPKEISKLQNIEHLEIFGNANILLPEEISNLKQMKKLILDFNQIINNLQTLSKLENKEIINLN